MLWVALASPVPAGVSDYEFQLVQNEVKKGDGAIVGRPPEDVAVESAPTGDHPQVLIAPPDHPLAKQRSISPQEIAGETILKREIGSGSRSLNTGKIQHCAFPRY